MQKNYSNSHKQFNIQVAQSMLAVQPFCSWYFFYFDLNYPFKGYTRSGMQECRNNIRELMKYLPGATKQEHFLANHKTRLPSSWTRCFSFCFHQMPHILGWIKTIEIIEMSIQDSVISTKYVNHTIVNNCNEIGKSLIISIKNKLILLD